MVYRIWQGHEFIGVGIAHVCDVLEAIVLKSRAMIWLIVEGSIANFHSTLRRFRPQSSSVGPRDAEGREELVVFRVLKN